MVNKKTVSEFSWLNAHTDCFAHRKAKEVIKDKKEIMTKDHFPHCSALEHGARDYPLCYYGKCNFFKLHIGDKAALDE